MKVLSFVAIAMSVLILGCSKDSSESGSKSTSVLPEKRKPLPAVIVPGRWVSEDEVTGLEHVVTFSAQGKWGYEIQRKSGAPVYSRESKKEEWELAKTKLNGHDAVIYRPQRLIERTVETGGATDSSCLPEQSPCMSQDGLSAVKGLGLKEDVAEFELNGQKFGREDVSETLKAGGQFAKREGHLIFRWTEDADRLAVSFNQVDKYDYRVSFDSTVHPEATHVLYRVYSKDLKSVRRLIDLKDPKGAFDEIRNGVVAHFQSYAQSGDGALEPIGRSEEIFMPTFKLDPEDFKGELQVDPKQGRYNRIDSSTVRVNLPYTPGRFEKIEVAGMEKIISKRSGYIGSLRGSDAEFEGRIATSRVIQLAQGSSIEVYFKILGGHRAFDEDTVQVLAATTPVYDLEYHTRMSCVLSGPSMWVSSTARVTFTAPYPVKWQVVSHTKSGVEISPWTDEVREFTKVFAFYNEKDTSRDVINFDLMYLDPRTGKARVVNKTDSYLSGVCHPDYNRYR